MDLLKTFCWNFIVMFVDMSFYIMIGLLFVGILNVFIKRKTILKHLGKDKFSSVVNASLVGVPLPLCSCGVVPTAIELKKDGASDGAVVSFLISTPQTGVDSIFATYSLMGLIMAIYRPIAAFLSGIIGGAIVNIFANKRKKNSVVEPVKACCCCHAKEEKKQVSSCCCSSHAHKEKKESNKFIQVLTYAYGEFLNTIALHFVMGVALAALIGTLVPADFFVNLGLHKGILAMLAMIIIGLPMYICSTSSIPIALSLMAKGLSLGSVFVFLFTGPVTNIASILILSKALGKKITGIYIAMVIFCSILFGYILDFIVKEFDIDITNFVKSKMECEELNVFSTIIAIIFALLLIRCFYRQIKAKF